jgi:hypothetical protein
MPGIEHPDVSTAKRLHHPASRSWFGWRHQQVSVVVHEDVGVKAAACFKQGHVEEFKVISPVIAGRVALRRANQFWWISPWRDSAMPRASVPSAIAQVGVGGCDIRLSVTCSDPVSAEKVI